MNIQGYTVLVPSQDKNVPSNKVYPQRRVFIAGFENELKMYF